jgi:hypothetical protein
MSMDVVIFRLVELYELGHGSPCPLRAIERVLELYQLDYREVYHMYTETGTEVDEYGFDDYLAEKLKQVEDESGSPFMISFDIVADSYEIEDWVYEFFGEIAKKENKNFIVAYDPHELVVVEIVEKSEQAQ